MNVSQQILIAIIALWIGSREVEGQIDYWPIEQRGKRAIGNHAEHLHDLGTHGINTFLLLSHRYAMLSIKTVLGMHLSSALLEDGFAIICDPI